MNELKEQIIYNVFMILETNENNYKIQAKEDIEKFAKYYHVHLKQTQKGNLKELFKKFILNKEGYQVILPKLYHSM